MEAQDRYVIKRRLGSGGMAEVHEAVVVGDQGFQRRVAIKRLLAERAGDAAFARMFLDEARIVSALHHGGIVAVYDFGVLEGRPFQVLELVDGLDARSLARRGKELGLPMPLEVALSIGVEVAHALHHAHVHKDDKGAPRGVVHRDVKPSNILVSWNGDVKLGDFGIAFAHDRAEKTVAGEMKGTPAYMAPEQMLADKVDGRADVFALGCSLHALIAGASPIQDQDRLRRLLLGEELALSSELPVDVAAAIARAVRSSPAERYANANEMASALGTILTRRLANDPKTVLLGWLGRIKPPEAAPPPRVAGKFDAWIGAEIGPLDGDVEGHERTVKRATDDAFSHEPHVVDEESVELPKHGPGPQLRAAVAIVLVGAAAIGAVALWRSRAPKTDAPPSIVASAAEPTALPSPSTIPTASTSAVVAVASGPRRPAPDRVTPPSVHASPPALPASRNVAPTASAPVVAGDLVTSGTIAVGGPSARGAQILVDGQSRGLAPKYVDVAIGTHKIELSNPDGTRVGPGTVDVGAQHTRSAPLRWP